MNFLGTRYKSVKSGRFGRQRFRLLRAAYLLLPWLGLKYERGIEWDFVLRHLPQHKITVLDVGAWSSLLLYELAARGCRTLACDVRNYAERLPPGINFIKCDVMSLAFGPGSLDSVTIVSVIEHVGLGFYGDPRWKDGDLRAMAEVRSVLKPGGLLLLTTVIGRDLIVTASGSHRIYDQEGLRRLTAGFCVDEERFYRWDRRRWRRVGKDVAFGDTGEDFGLAMLALRKI